MWRVERKRGRGNGGPWITLRLYGRKMKYDIKEIAEAMGAEARIRRDAEIEWVITDSRSLVFPETSVFFALRTEKNDGHRYVADLRRRGVYNFVVSDMDGIGDSQGHDGANFLMVDDTLRALQRLAAWHRGKFGIPIVGVTGSVGKTAVKEWIAQMAGGEVRLTRSPRSYNSQIGVPLSLMLLDGQTEVGVFEVGISKPGEMERLSDVVRPTIGVLTRLGDAHGENFENRREKCREKMKLFRGAKAMVYCCDDEDVRACAAETDGDVRRYSWSRTRDDAYLKVVTRAEGGRTYIRMGNGGEREWEFDIPFDDAAAVENAVTAAVTCIAMGETTPKAELRNWQERARELSSVSTCMEVKEALRDSILVVDSGNDDLNSLGLTLDFIASRGAGTNGKGKKRVAILSDVVGTGMTREEICRRVTLTLRAHGVSKLLAVGRQSEGYKNEDGLEVRGFLTTGELLESGEIEKLEDCIVLLKGARGFGFEKVSAQMVRRKHQTSLRVSLSGVAHNLGEYRKLLGKDRKIVCMVKADAYGMGAAEISKTLENAGVDYLAVAVADEGVALRRAGIDAGIIVMNPEPEALRDMFRYKLQPEVYGFGLLERLISDAEALGVRNMPIHVKIDTGMHRLGFDPERDVERLIERLKGQEAVIVRSVFSHFAGADEKSLDEFTALQFKRFKGAAERISKAFGHKILHHICNTAGIARFPEYHCDMARLGLGLYGIHPGPDGPSLKNVATLRTVILQIRRVAAPETVGYGRKGRIEGERVIASVPIGYADGLDRKMGNGKGYCVVGGKKARYVGNICMDMSMIDVSGIECAEGDEVTVFGNEPSVEEVSGWIGTIPYEVLTSVSPRVVREYSWE